MKYFSTIHNIITYKNQPDIQTTKDDKWHFVAKNDQIHKFQ